MTTRINEKRMSKSKHGMKNIPCKARLTEFAYRKETFVKKGPDRGMKVDTTKGTLARFLGSTTRIELEIMGSSGRNLILVEKYEETGSLKW